MKVNNSKCDTNGKYNEIKIKKITFMITVIIVDLWRETEDLVEWNSGRSLLEIFDAIVINLLFPLSHYWFSEN